MSSVILSGNTSGTVTLSAPAVAGSNTVTLPAATGTVELITQGTAVSASGTSVDFTGIPSWVKRITVMFNGVSTNGTSGYLIQLGDSGGIESTGYSSTNAAIFGTSPNSSTSTAGFLATYNAAAANTQSGICQIMLIDTNTWVFSGIIKGGTGIYYGGGDKATSATLDRVRITTVNGTDTFDAGTINIMYEG